MLKHFTKTWKCQHNKKGQWVMKFRRKSVQDFTASHLEVGVFFNLRIFWIYFSLEQRQEWLIKKQNTSKFQSLVVIMKVIPFFFNHLIYILVEKRHKFIPKSSPENCSEILFLIVMSLSLISISKHFIPASLVNVTSYKKIILQSIVFHNNGGAEVGRCLISYPCFDNRFA